MSWLPRVGTAESGGRRSSTPGGEGALGVKRWGSSSRPIRGQAPPAAGTMMSMLSTGATAPTPAPSASRPPTQQGKEVPSNPLTDSTSDPVIEGSQHISLPPSVINTNNTSLVESPSQWMVGEAADNFSSLSRPRTMTPGATKIRMVAVKDRKMRPGMATPVSRRSASVEPVHSISLIEDKSKFNVWPCTESAGNKNTITPRRSTAGDPAFLRKVRDFIHVELQHLDANMPSAKVRMYREVLTMFVDEFKLYSDVLASIRGAYDERVLALEDLVNEFVLKESNGNYERERFVVRQEEALQQHLHEKQLAEETRKKYYVHMHEFNEEKQKLEQTVKELQSEMQGYKAKQEMDRVIRKDVESNLATYIKMYEKLKEEWEGAKAEVTQYREKSMAEIDSLKVQNSVLTQETETLRIQLEDLQSTSLPGSPTHRRGNKADDEARAQASVLASKQVLQWKEMLRTAEGKIAALKEQIEARNEYEPPVPWHTLGTDYNEMRRDGKSTMQIIRSIVLNLHRLEKNNAKLKAVIKPFEELFRILELNESGDITTDTSQIVDMMFRQDDDSKWIPSAWSAPEAGLTAVNLKVSLAHVRNTLSKAWNNASSQQIVFIEAVRQHVVVPDAVTASLPEYAANFVHVWTRCAQFDSFLKLCLMLAKQDCCQQYLIGFANVYRGLTVALEKQDRVLNGRVQGTVPRRVFFDTILELVSLPTTSLQLARLKHLVHQAQPAAKTIKWKDLLHTTVVGAALDTPFVTALRLHYAENVVWTFKTFTDSVTAACPSAESMMTHGKLSQCMADTFPGLPQKTAAAWAAVGIRGGTLRNVLTNPQPRSALEDPPIAKSPFAIPTLDAAPKKPNFEAIAETEIAAPVAVKNVLAGTPLLYVSNLTASAAASMSFSLNAAPTSPLAASVLASIDVAEAEEDPYDTAAMAASAMAAPTPGKRKPAK